MPGKSHSLPGSGGTAAIVDHSPRLAAGMVQVWPLRRGGQFPLGYMGQRGICKRQDRRKVWRICRYSSTNDISFRGKHSFPPRSGVAATVVTAESGNRHDPFGIEDLDLGSCHALIRRRSPTPKGSAMALRVYMLGSSTAQTLAMSSSMTAVRVRREPAESGIMPDFRGISALEDVYRAGYDERRQDYRAGGFEHHEQLGPWPDR